MFSCCHFIKGANRSLLLDTQRDSYYIVPNSMPDFIASVADLDFDHALSEYDHGNCEIAMQYVNFLLKNDLAFFCDSHAEAAAFIAMPLSWEYPSELTNMVIELSNPHYIPAIIQCIGNNFIPTIHVVIYSQVANVEQLQGIILPFHQLSNKSIQISFENKEQIDAEQLSSFCHNHPKIELIIAFNSSVETSLNMYDCSVIFTKQSEFGKTACGTFHLEYFNTNVRHFTESLQHNTCLNRKISIDTSGDIKNCPSMTESFGNIWDTKLLEAIKKTGFRKYWNLTKDQIAICKDCEFRHICTDCRAYLEEPEDIFSKPLKCGYDPYKNEWANWTTSPIKQRAIYYYSLE